MGVPAWNIGRRHQTGEKSGGQRQDQEAGQSQGLPRFGDGRRNAHGVCLPPTSVEGKRGTGFRPRRLQDGLLVWHARALGNQGYQPGPAAGGLILSVQGS